MGETSTTSARTGADAGTVLVVAGFAREARIAAGEGVSTIQAGGQPDRLREALRSRVGGPLRAVISFGIAGGLDPALAPGDIVIGTGVHAAGKRWPCTPEIAASFGRRLAPIRTRVIVADVAGEEKAVLTPDSKSELHGRTAAAAVDMESHVAAAFAAEHGLPFGIVRVVCDPASRALPALAANALKPNGEPDLPALLAALAARPTAIGALLVLARDSGRAFRTLSRARPLLGFALGVDA